MTTSRRSTLLTIANLPKRELTQEQPAVERTNILGPELYEAFGNVTNRYSTLILLNPTEDYPQPQLIE